MFTDIYQVFSDLNRNTLALAADAAQDVSWLQLMCDGSDAQNTRPVAGVQGRCIGIEMPDEIERIVHGEFAPRGWFLADVSAHKQFEWAFDTIIPIKSANIRHDPPWCPVFKACESSRQGINERSAMAKSTSLMPYDTQALSPITARPEK